MSLTAPHLILLAVGDDVQYSYAPDRENWIIQMDYPDIQSDPKNPWDLLLQCGNRHLRIPRLTPLSEVEVIDVKSRFKDIMQLYRDPSDLARCRVAAKVTSMIGFILDRHAGTQEQSPSGRLKQLIDSDDHWTRNLDEMSRECGYNPDHLRRLFMTEFGIKPHEYRYRRRITQITQALTDSSEPIADIAARFGFRHLSHLCMTYKRATGMTPSQARTSLRHAPAPSARSRRSAGNTPRGTGPDSQNAE